MAYTYNPWANVKSQSVQSGYPGATYGVLQPFTQAPGAVSPFNAAVDVGKTPMAASNPAYNVNPAPTTGINNPTGLVPGALPAVNPYLATTTTMATPTKAVATQVGTPATVAMPDPYGDLLKVIPGLAGMNAQAGSVISNDLSGRISPEVVRQIQNEAARFGVSSGMPGTNTTPGSLYNFKDLATLGTTSDAVQQRGLASYGDFLKTISGTQTVSPSVQAGVNEANAGAANQFALANQAALNNYGQFNANALNQANQWNAGAMNQGSQFNAAAGNATNPLNVQIADRNATNAAAANPWLAMNYAADLLARNSAATAGRPYVSQFNPNTATGQFGGWATPQAGSGTVDPWLAYLQKIANQSKWGSTMLSGYGAPGF